MAFWCIEQGWNSYWLGEAPTADQRPRRVGEPSRGDRKRAIQPDIYRPNSAPLGWLIHHTWSSRDSSQLVTTPAL
jgi:hypothetical protein